MSLQISQDEYTVFPANIFVGFRAWCWNLEGPKICWMCVRNV